MRVVLCSKYNCAFGTKNPPFFFSILKIAFVPQKTELGLNRRDLPMARANRSFTFRLSLAVTFMVC